mgnify:CR=1 FL=1
MTQKHEAYKRGNIFYPSFFGKLNYKEALSFLSGEMGLDFPSVISLTSVTFFW